MKHEKQCHTFKEWYNNQKKEVQYALCISGVTTIVLLGMAIDGLVDAGITNFIIGTISFMCIGVLAGLAFLIFFWILASIAPKKAEKLINWITYTGEEDCDDLY